LSGYGLTVSAINKSRPIAKFYKDRLVKLLVPFWIILSALFLLDFFVLNKSYPVPYMISSFLGFFNSADLYNDVDSPLWYFTLILFYYLIFPLVFRKKQPWLSAAIIYALTYLIMAMNPGWLSKVKHFQELHIIAFPLGVFFAGLLCSSVAFQKSLSVKIANFLKKSQPARLLKNIAYWFLILALLFAIGYTSYDSGVGKGVGIEQTVSIVTTLAFIFLFLIKKLEIKLFYLFGLYSYEIYLFHWPLLYRYDIFFKFFPAWLAMVMYLILFVVLAWLLQKVSKLITSRIL
jgi:peptidoglycan/LPS O-acetylase OafA/YrhL